MKINYFSDIHLEFGELEAPDTTADLIVAAGDIGIDVQGVEWLKTLNKPVIYIAGNHEFYGCDMVSTLPLLREQCAGSNVNFLEKNKFIFQDIRFLGCTLWTDLFVEGDEKAEGLGNSLNDFRQIIYAEKAFDVDKFSKLHRTSKKWLKQELAVPFKGKTVVVTHHAPSQWSWDESPNALKKLAYCNDLKPLMHEFEISAWFHGHTHSLSNYRVAGTRILCNPRGYLGRKTVADFDRNKTVVI